MADTVLFLGLGSFSVPVVGGKEVLRMVKKLGYCDSDGTEITSSRRKCSGAKESSRQLGPLFIADANLDLSA